MACSDESDALETCLLMLQDECPAEDLQITLKTALKILRNIQQNPGVEKFRCLRKENKTFNDRVWKWESAQQLLYSIGWTEVDETVVLPDDSQVPQAIQLIEAILGNDRTQSEGHQENGLNREPKMTEKEKLLADERRKMLEQMKRDKEERIRIRNQIRADRKDVGTRESKDSHAREMKFGADMKKFKDIGIDLNRGGG